MFSKTSPIVTLLTNSRLTFYWTTIRIVFLMKLFPSFDFVKCRQEFIFTYLLFMPFYNPTTGSYLNHISKNCAYHSTYMKCFSVFQQSQRDLGQNFDKLLPLYWDSFVFSWLIFNMQLTNHPFTSYSNSPTKWDCLFVILRIFINLLCYQHDCLLRF